MSEFNLLDIVGEPYVPQVLSLVETLHILDKDVMVSEIEFPHKSEYDNIQWSDPQDKTVWPEHVLLDERLNKTKEVWVTQLMTEANKIQNAALSLHTITDANPLHQKSMYQIKYDQSVKYANRVHAWLTTEGLQPTLDNLPTEEQVSVPDILGNEAKHTGDPLYYLALAIIENYEASEKTLQAYYGEVEGIRRIKKAEIVNAPDIAALSAISWVKWPKYVGNPPNPKD